MEFRRTQLKSRNHKVEKGIVTFDDRLIEGKRILPAAKLLIAQPTRVAEIQDFVLVQAGLPGSWLQHAEIKAEQYIQNGHHAAVMLVLPEGIPAQSELIDLTPQNPDEDVVKNHREYFERKFTFDGFVRSLFALYSIVRESSDNPDMRVHLAGHSYGAVALLNTMRLIQRNGSPLPQSIHFLAPFVKLSIDDDYIFHQLSIINSEILQALNPKLKHQIARLRSLLETCKEFLNVDEEVDLVDEHRAIFQRRFYSALRGLSRGMALTPITVVRGSNDDYIGRDHVELVAIKFERTIQEIERIIDGDDHDLNSLDFADLERR
jgi:hypothetical protein